MIRNTTSSELSVVAFSLLEVLSTGTTTTVSVPVREEVLALGGAGTICAFVLLHTTNATTTRGSYDRMFRATDDVVIIKIFASRGIITTLITFGFGVSSSILPFASLGRGIVVLFLGLMTISSS